VDRSDALAYIAGTYAQLATETGTTVTDDAAGFGFVIDAAARAFGDPDPTTLEVSDDLIDDFQALLDYYALQRLSRAAAAKVDIGSGSSGTTKSRSQLFAQIRDLLEDARRIAVGMGYVLGKGFRSGYINLDFIEAAEEEFG
jgi:hypothetical protein